MIKILIYHFTCIVLSFCYKSVSGQEIVKFDADLIGNQLSIMNPDLGDSTLIGLEFKRYKGDLTSFESTDPEISLMINGSTFADGPLNFKKKNVGYLVCKRTTQTTHPHAIIKFHFNWKGEQWTQKVVVKKYTAIFNQKYDSDPFVLSRGDMINDLILFEQAGTTTWVTIEKNGQVVFKDGYLSSPVLEFPIDNFGLGEYKVSYHALYDLIEFKLFYTE